MILDDQLWQEQRRKGQLDMDGLINMLYLQIIENKITLRTVRFFKS